MPERIDKLTPAQEARMPEWRDKWIAIGLQTGDADFATFDTAMRVAYQKAKIPFPNRTVRVQSPLVGALAASIACAILVRGAVRDAVRDAVGDAVRGAVGDAVRGAVGDGLRWHDWLGGQFWAGGWRGSPSNVSFFTDVAGLVLNADIAERAKAYRDICESVNYVWPNSKFVMVCDRPKRILRDAEGRLHSDQFKAIEYKDGWGLYCLEGITLSEARWTGIVKHTLSFVKMMQIENADERAVALKYNPGALLQIGARLVNRSEWNGDELYQLTDRELLSFVRKAEIYLLKMECPTGRTFYEFVEPEFARANPTANACQARAWGITPESYRSVVVHG